MHEFGRRFGLVPGLAHDHRDRLADEAGLFYGEDRDVLNTPAIHAPRQIGAREGGHHAGLPAGGQEVDRNDPRMWIRAAHEDRVAEPGQG